MTARKAWPGGAGSGRLVSRTLALAAGWGTCALALPEARRPALFLAALAAVLLPVALVTGWRVLGSLAVLVAAAAPLMAAALEQRAAAAGRLVLLSLLVLVTVAGLDGADRPEPAARAPGVLRPASPLRRGVAPLVAVAACLVSVGAAATPATPSLGLVLLGLLAGVAAVLTATREH